MALTKTTLSSAVGALDKQIVVASATSIVAGRLIRVDGEMMKVTPAYVAGSTTVTVLRGREGTESVAHVTGANVIHGDFGDWGVTGGAMAPFGPQPRPRRTVSVTASGTLTPPNPGEDLLVILNGTSVINLTIAVPTKDLEGCELTICSNGAAAHTVTFTGGISGAGSAYDVLTFNSSAPVGIKAIAVNELWLTPIAPAMGGTVTNLIASVA
jgi:hypothetical protein